MIIKSVGIMLVMASTVLAGLYMALKDSFRIKDLRQMKSALLVLRSEIEYGLTPLPEAMNNAASKCGSPVKEIFLRFDENITGRKESVYELWCEALDDYFKSSFFTKSDMECFKAFGKALGYLDKNMQLSNIDMITNYIDESLQSAGITSEKNKKLYNSLGVLGGLLVIILFI